MDKNINNETPPNRKFKLIHNLLEIKYDFHPDNIATNITDQGNQRPVNCNNSSIVTLD